MSKIIDALEKVREFSARSEEAAAAHAKGGSASGGGSAPKARPGSSYQATQEELADVYFSRSGKAQQALPGPTLVRVVDRRASYFWPWAVTTTALVFTAFALIFSGRVNVDVRMAGDAAPAEGGSALGGKSARPSGPAIPVAAGSFYFSEAAAPRSSANAKGLMLAGSETEGPVYAALHLDPPFDARAHELEFEARGRDGGEEFEVRFRDSRRQTSLNRGALVPFPSGLGTAWQKGSVSVSSAEGFDASRVELLKIETGRRGAVLVRNLKWRPRPPA